MITQLTDRISIGGEGDCMPGLNVAGTKATIHACKFPCHMRYAKQQLPKDHPNYLAFIYPFDLVLNMIDPAQPLFKRETFAMAREFGRAHLRRNNDLFIHCNKAESRAPSLAMLIMAKELGEIGDESYDAARTEFEAIYPAFKPGLGIEAFMRENWNEL